MGAISRKLRQKLRFSLSIAHAELLYKQAVLCDIFQLRRDGLKLPEPTGPHRGWLRLDRFTVANEKSLHADLYASDSQGAPALLPGPHHVEVQKMDGRGLLLFGLQSARGEPITHPGHKQAWFCRPAATQRTDE